tara:strand:+ start:616 stop:1500 length:885 start_codon:yes stop_codon:yes gene_type:complete
MNILITGVNGYLGEVLSNELKSKKHNIIGCDVFGNFSSEVRQIDVRDKNLVIHFPEEIDIIIHLAALSSDPLCKDNEYECFDLNVMGTLNLINFAKLKKCKQFIFASSEWVYNDSPKMNKENSLIDLTKLKSEYALSKLTSEINLLQKFDVLDLDITILRFGIIYGGQREKGSAIESIIKHLVHNDEIKIGSKKTGRNFIHYLDVVNGIISSIGQRNYNKYNIVGDNYIDLEKIIKIAEKKMNKKIKIHENDKDNPSIRMVSNEFAKKHLNWRPMVKIEDGIQEIIDQYKIKIK